jgi:hypothetical protein
VRPAPFLSTKTPISYTARKLLQKRNAAEEGYEAVEKNTKLKRNAAEEGYEAVEKNTKLI